MPLEITIPPPIEGMVRQEASRRGVTADAFALLAIIDQLPAQQRRAAAAELARLWEREGDDGADDHAEVLRAIDSHRPEGQKLFTEVLKNYGK
jgi:hypothetical protein